MSEPREVDTPTPKRPKTPKAAAPASDDAAPQVQPTAAPVATKRPGVHAAGVAHVGSATVLSGVKLAGGIASELGGATWRIAGRVRRATHPGDLQGQSDGPAATSQVGPSANGVSDAGGVPHFTSDDEAKVFESPLAGQVTNLAWNFAIAFSHLAARLFEVIAGPLERLMSPDPTIHDDERLVLGPVLAGQRATGEFSLANASPHDAVVTVLITNPPASTLGVIPIDRVQFAPRPVTVPGGASCTVKATVDVPAATQPGRYLAIARSDEVPDLTLVVEIDVT